VNEHDDDAQRVPRKPTRNEGAHPRGPHPAAEATRYRSRQETGKQGEVSTNDPVRFCERCSENDQGNAAVPATIGPVHGPGAAAPARSLRFRARLESGRTGQFGRLEFPQERSQ